MASKKPQSGDLYGCALSDGIRCFQYVCDDSSQLGSQVIAVFKEKFFSENEVKGANISSLEVDFFAHVFISMGLKTKVWNKISSASVICANRILFRSTNDYGKPNVTQSDDWWVWEVNGPKTNVGSLVGEARKSFLGVVMPPANIVDRLTTGKYSYFYPTPVGDELYWE